MKAYRDDYDTPIVRGEKVVVVGKKNHIDAYTQLFAHVLSLPAEKVSDIDGMDFALAGFLEILKAQVEKKRPD